MTSHGKGKIKKQIMKKCRFVWNERFLKPKMSSDSQYGIKPESVIHFFLFQSNLFLLLQHIHSAIKSNTHGKEDIISTLVAPCAYFKFTSPIGTTTSNFAFCDSFVMYVFMAIILLPRFGFLLNVCESPTLMEVFSFHCCIVFYSYE